MCAALGAGNAASAADLTPATTREVTLNVRDFGAIGDGQLHRVGEWIESRRFSSLRALQREFPFVDSPQWSIDEVAFEAAKRALPEDGGTIHFPVGHYVTGRFPWRIWRDNVRITGDGAERTILATAADIPDGLSVAPYRHVGWLEGAGREFAYAAEAGARGSDTVALVQPELSREFRAGELVFIRNGANRYDQDYGEFNEIARVEPAGRLVFRFPFARDYTLERFNWAGEVAEELEMPKPGREAKVSLRTGPGFFVPDARATVSIGENLFRVTRVQAGRNGRPAVVRLENPGRSNAPPGTRIAAGAKVGKARSIVKLTRTVRNFRCENLQIVGRRKALVVSNSYEVAFADCTFLRDLRDGGFKGGLTIDGDGGRFARFDRCRIVARPAAGMQFARSFGGVVFAGCSFVDANVAFTEFNFDCEVTRCTFEITGGRELANVIIAGKSCGDLRFLENRIRARGVAVVLDTHSDIQSQKHGSEGEIVVRGNVIETENVPDVFTRPRFDRLALDDNRITAR
ncbi:hypothetical protein [Opitutus terrae]|uniref:hypothetical protein n=1 Tax=Opitutus terrae TaxID=107709 RepID=UPI0003077B4A|nr:hypothetical protein [Opitutus terrae]